jgi:hypothetical protein
MSHKIISPPNQLVINRHAPRLAVEMAYALAVLRAISRTAAGCARQLGGATELYRQ